MVLMHVDPDLRSLAARTLVDALVAMDVTAAGKESTDNAMLLALEPIGIDRSDPRQVANYAAALDLLFFFVAREASQSGADYEVVLANLRALLPQLGY